MVFMNVQTYYSGRERGKEVETKEKVLIYYAVNILYVAITTSFMFCTIMIIMNSLFVSFNTRYNKTRQRKCIIILQKSCLVNKAKVVHQGLLNI